jgi:predicted RNA-binding Zn-ribbon protein involved in translation (DUF1610 family)
MESSKCPKCGDDPHFIAHVDKWYCFGCNSYVGEADEIVEEEQVQNEVAPAKVDKHVSMSPAPAGTTPIECKSCGAELQDLKDGRLYCFMCETYQDEIKDGPEHIENEAQALVDQASVITPSVPPAIPQVPVIVPPTPTTEVKPVDTSPAPAPAVAQPSAPETPAPIELPAPPAEKPAFVRMCTSCGQPLKYIDKYQRYYCYGCKKYSSKDDKLRGSADKKKCPDCGGELRFIEKYNEHYCNSCKKYPLRTSKIAPAKTEVLSCTKCGTPLKWVEKYSRHYCYTCKEYAPKGQSGSVAPSTPTEKKTCPSCNESMKFIAEYNEWYCYKCRKYSLRPSKPAMFL